MSKPQIIGYETDPNATNEQLSEAEFWDIHGVGVWMEARMRSWPYSTVEINDDNRTEFFRAIGFRPVYQERNFRAELRNSGGYDLHCRRCNTWETFTGRGPSGPHDMAAFHEKWFHLGGQTASQIMLDMARKAQFDLDTDQWHEAL